MSETTSEEPEVVEVKSDVPLKVPTAVALVVRPERFA